MKMSMTTPLRLHAGPADMALLDMALVVAAVGRTVRLAVDKMAAGKTAAASIAVAILG